MTFRSVPFRLDRCDEQTDDEHFRSVAIPASERDESMNGSHEDEHESRREYRELKPRSERQDISNSRASAGDDE